VLIHTVPPFVSSAFCLLNTLSQHEVRRSRIHPLSVLFCIQFSASPNLVVAFLDVLTIVPATPFACSFELRRSRYLSFPHKLFCCSPSTLSLQTPLQALLCRKIVCLPFYDKFRCATPTTAWRDRTRHGEVSETLPHKIPLPPRSTRPLSISLCDSSVGPGPRGEFSVSFTGMLRLDGLRINRPSPQR